jgi:hypothetical protein
MNQDLLIEIRERLIRIEEQAKGRDSRLDRVEVDLGHLGKTVERVRWWILGGIGAAGSIGGFASDSFASLVK